MGSWKSTSPLVYLDEPKTSGWHLLEKHISTWQLDMDVSENRVNTLKSSLKNRGFPLFSPSILGVFPLFLETSIFITYTHPFIKGCFSWKIPTRYRKNAWKSPKHTILKWIFRNMFTYLHTCQIISQKKSSPRYSHLTNQSQQPFHHLQFDTGPTTRGWKHKDFVNGPLPVTAVTVWVWLQIRTPLIGAIPSGKLTARPWKSPSFLVNTIKMVNFPWLC